MIKAALEYIVGLNKPETVRHGGGVYADKPLYQMKRRISHVEIEHTGKHCALCAEDWGRAAE